MNQAVSPTPRGRRRARPAAIAAALVLIGISVFGGALSASAGPSAAPVITLPTSGPDSDQFPTVQGDVAEDGLTVVVEVTNNGITSPYCTDTFADIATGFSCGSSVSFEYGVNTITAYSFYTSGVPDSAQSPLSDPVTYTRYGVSGPTVTTSPPTGTTDSTPAFGGTGPHLGTAHVFEGGVLLCSSPVDVAGNWACDSIPLAPGPHTGLTVTAEDLQSVPRGPSAFPPDFAVLAPTPPTINQTFPDPWITDDPHNGFFQGGKDADEHRIVLEVSPDDVTFTAYCDVTGLTDATIWYCPNPNLAPLTHGLNYVRATGYNSAGTPSARGPALTITLVDSPVISSPGNGSYTNDPILHLSGSVEGDSITVYRDGEFFLCGAGAAGSTWSCDSDPLPDGTYALNAIASPGTMISSATTSVTIDTVVVAPTIGAPGTTTDRTPTFFGSGEPGASITVYVNGSPVACVGGDPIVDAGGAWTCTVANSLAVDSYTVSARQVDRAGNVSGISSAVTLQIVAPPVLPVTETPTPRPPLVWTLNTGGIDEVLAGDTVTLSSTGLPGGSNVDAEFHSTIVKLGATVVKPDGTFALNVTIPEDAEPGLHHFVVTVSNPDDGASMVEVPVTVMVAPKGTAGGDKEALVELIPDDGATPPVDRNNPAAPSSFTHSINTLALFFSNPIVIGTAAVAGLALLLFVAFPAELLNSTISEQYPRFSKRVPKAPWLTRFTDWLERTPLFGGIAITIVAAVIFGFADPGFGFDITSVRLVLACAIALFIVGYLASVIAGRILGKRWGLDTVMELKPLGLVLTVIGVVISRLLDFSPGLLVGLILGVALFGRTTVADRAKATLVQAGVVFVLAVLGWVGYSIASAVLTPDSFGSALMFDTLVAVTSEGLTALFIGLLPFKFLDGASIFEYSKVIWAACYTVAAVAFLGIVLPSAWGEVGGSIPVWIGIVGGFFVVALGIYFYFRFWAPPIEEDGESDATEAVAEKVESR